MIRALSALRADSSVITAALNVFVAEPSVDWFKLARRQHIERDDFIEKKMETVRKKLWGEHPSRTALKELVLGGRAGRHLKELQEALLGPKESVRRGLWQAEKFGSLGAAEQVDCLVEWASDPGVLRCAYVGWKSVF